MTRLCRAVQALGLILLAVVPSASAPHLVTDSSATPLPSEHVVRLRIDVQSDAPGARLALTPGVFTASRVVSSHGVSSLTRSKQGWTVRRSLSSLRATASLDSVYVVWTDLPTLRLTLDATGLGRASVMVRAIAADGNSTVLFSGGVLGLLGKVTSRSWVAPSTVLTERLEQHLSRSPEPKRVLAFYYPWWSTYDDPRLSDRPAVERDTMHARGVASMVQQSHSAGVDGLVVSWAANDASRLALRNVLAQEEAVGGVAAPYLEAIATADVSPSHAVDPALVADWLAQALAYSSSPAFLRDSTGVPVVFVFGMAKLTPAQWRWVVERAGQPVRLVGDTASDSYKGVAWGSHRYRVEGSIDSLERWALGAAARARSTHLLVPSVPSRTFVATVSPGYDDTGLAPERPDTSTIDRAGGARYDALWRAALAADPDWVVITSWNEWFEGSSIEPSREQGDLALEQTRRWAAAFKAS